jgi:peptidoglycan hydrolase FlgJ
VTLPLAPIGSPSTGAADASRLKTRGNLDKAATQFEAVFTRMMLSSMRKTKLADTLFESKALDTFRDMQDGQVAEAMAAHAPMGIGRAVTDFLARSQSDLNGSAASTPDS